MSESFYQALGIAGAVIVTTSNLPQMWMFIRQKHAEGISKSSTWVGLIGVLLRTIFILHTTSGSLVLLGPYYFAIACIILTLYYSYFPGK